MSRLAGAVLAAALLAGCGGSSDETPVPKQTDSEVIRGWIAALDAGDYVAAASYFASNAVVQQSDVFRLRTQAEAEEFNRGLPCKADVSDTKDEGRTTVAVFHLRRGPGGPCHGNVRVRFTIEGGKMKEWRQLPEHESGPVA